MTAKSLLLLPFLLIACASPADDETESGADMLTAGEGEICGGFAGTLCSPGLRCNYGRGLSTGTCAEDPNAASRGVAEGEVCGGTANIQCKAGLTCKKRAAASATAKGKCEAAGVSCMAFPTCDEGHNAVASANDCLQDDAACYKRSMCGRSIWCTGVNEATDADKADQGTGAGRGEMCGGMAGTTCRAPLRCDNSLGLGTGRCR